MVTLNCFALMILLATNSLVMAHGKKPLRQYALVRKYMSSPLYENLKSSEVKGHKTHKTATNVPLTEFKPTSAPSPKQSKKPIPLPRSSSKVKGLKLVESLIEEHVVSTIHPVEKNPAVFFAFDNQVRSEIAEGRSADGIDKTSGQHETRFPHVDFQGFNMHFRGAPTSKDSLGSVSVYIIFADELVAKKAAEAFDTKEMSEDELSEHLNQWSNSTLIVDYVDGSISFSVGNEYKLLPVIKVIDIVNAYFDGWKGKVTSFLDLPLSATQASCSLCSKFVAVDEYVRMSKALIEAVHTTPILKRLHLPGHRGKRLANRLRHAKGFIRGIFGRPNTPLSEPPRLMRVKEESFVQWLPVHVTALGDDSDVPLAYGILFLPGKKLMLYYGGGYRTYAHAKNLPEGIQTGDFVRVTIWVRCKGKLCGIAEGVDEEDFVKIKRAKLTRSRA